MALEFSGKDVLIVDGTRFSNGIDRFLTRQADSIVRGTTSKEIIQMAKDVGAKSVIVASCAPPIRYARRFQSLQCGHLTIALPPRHSNVYGIDMPSRKELVAYGRSTDAIAEAIGAWMPRVTRVVCAAPPPNPTSTPAAPVRIRCSAAV